MNAKRSERGQVLVIIVLALVGMFGFAAIAVDGGRYFAERRRAQNAADAAAYAAAYAGITEEDYRTAGIMSTQNNGYNDTDGAINAGAKEDVQVFRPPTRGRYATASETINPNEYYQVIIRYKVDQVFSQIVYGGDLWVEVEAVARGTGNGGFGPNGAMVATCEDCCPAMKFTGNAQITITDGDVISLSDCQDFAMDLNGAPGCVKITNGSAVTKGKIDWHSGEKKCAGDKLQVDEEHAILEDQAIADTYKYYSKPTCNGPVNPPIVKIHKQPDVYSPGTYTGGIKITGDAQFKPGLYCVDGDFEINSGAVTGSNVMFYMRSAGPIILNNSTAVTLSAPTGEPCIIPDPTIGCWSGFLYFVPWPDDPPAGSLTINGGLDSQYTGTIYAPGAECKINGSGSGDAGVVLDGSIICYTFDIDGGKGIGIQYNGASGMQPTGAIEISE